MTEWKTYRAEDYCLTVTDGTHDSPKPQAEGRYLITSKHLKPSGIDFSSANKICEEDYQKIIQRSKVEQYDILFSMIGTVGNIHRVTIPIVDFAVKNMGIFKMGGDANKSLWMYYWLQSPIAQEYIQSRITGSTQGYLTLGNLRDFPVCAPSLEEQPRIAGILGAIDDKIENNCRINTNLELQAQALFDKIFFDDKDAERNPLSDYANINPTRTLRQGVVARYIEMANLPTKGSFPSDWSYKSYGGGCKFANGDTIMARITPCLENGKTAYIDFMEEQEVAFGSTEYIVISAKSGYCPALFYFLARNKEFVDYAVGHMTGSSGRQRVGGVDIANFPMPHISLEDSNKFAEIAMPIMDVIRNNSLENRQLANLRDILLPKLMNGEIKVAE